jgi:ADP-heptose:LPS heptosyltransferase
MRPEAASILAMHLGALGDFVISWPALGLLAAKYRLHLWGRPAWARLVLPPERIHDRESARYASLFSSRPEAELGAWLKGFKAAAVFSHRPQADIVKNLEQVLPVWHIPTRPQPDSATHAAQVQLDALAQRGIQGRAAPLTPKTGPARPPRPVIAPGSGGKAKRLPFAAVRSFCQTHAQNSPGPLVILGPAEDPDYREELSGRLEGLFVDYLLDPDMEQLAAHLAAASPYLGADSGVSHLAGAVGARGWVGFGPSDPAVWSPWRCGLKAVAFDRLLNTALTKPWEKE